MNPAPPASPTTPPSLPPAPTAAGPAPAGGTPPGAFARLDFTGRTLGDFRLLRRLGEGGMGQVYLAEQLSLQRRVAVKLLRPDFLDNETFLKRFKAEAKAVAQLAHPNIVQVHAVGEDQGLHYMALEYVEGLNLKDYLHRKGPPDLPVALAIVRQITAALVKSAELGIVHRDIKPENILVTRRAEVKVTDFGLSRIVGEELHLTQTGTTMGTPLYMSPEQILGQEVDPRSDLYSLGATCYHLLTGQPPFTGESAMAVGLKHLSEAPTPVATLRPDVPPDLAKLVHHLLAKKPEDRPQSAREVLREVRRLLEGLTGGTAPDDESPPTFDLGSTPSLNLPPAGPATGRRWLWPVVLGSVAVAVIGGGAIGLLLRGDTPTPRPAGPTRSTGSTRPQPTPPAKPKSPVKQAGGNAAIDTLEEPLRRRIEETKVARDPDKPLDLPLERVTRGVRARAELMRLYVLHHDADTLGRARRFAAAELADPVAPPTYHGVARVGLAAVEAFEGRFTPSAQHLDQALLLRDRPARRRGPANQLLRHHEIQDVLLVTLKLHEEQGPLPRELQDLKDEIERIRKNEMNAKPRPNKPPG